MKKNQSNRRSFVRNITGAGAAAVLSPFAGTRQVTSAALPGSGHLKIGLNAFSFNDLLLAGKMTIDDLLEFCVKTGIGSVDITGYYFPGYPLVPPDDFIFNVKKKAFRLGIELGCTGVRNDFTWSDPARRQGEKKLVKEWINVAQKLGSPGVRIFAGTLSKEEVPREERARWIADDILECADYGKDHGVMVVLQNHYDFLRSAEDVEKMLKMVAHPWVGLMLDVGSYHSPDPYADIAATAKYAVTWQMKEKVFINDDQVEADYGKIINIVRQCGYRGYLPIETLGEGDPYTKVEILYRKIKSILEM